MVLRPPKKNDRVRRVTRENPRVRRALELLNGEEQVKAIKIHGSVFQERGNPDIIACVRGVMCVAEMKTEAGELSALQTKRLTQWKEAGAKVIVSTSAFEVCRLILLRRGNW
jgi:Holliday junction resolvase